MERRFLEENEGFFDPEENNFGEEVHYANNVLESIQELEALERDMDRYIMDQAILIASETKFWSWRSPESKMAIIRNVYSTFKDIYRSEGDSSIELSITSDNMMEDDDEVMDEDEEGEDEDEE